MLFLALLEKEGQGSRAKIMEALRRQPGMNLSQLCNAVNLSWTTTKYHLGRLQAQGVVELQKRGRRDIQCFPIGVPAKYRPWLATLLDEEAVRILQALKDREAGVAELAKRVGLSESATRRRLERMRRDGVLAKRGKLRPRYARNPDSPEPAGEEDADSGVGP